MVQPSEEAPGDGCSREPDRQSLDYDAVVRTLHGLVGQRVLVTVGDAETGAGFASILGRLHSGTPQVTRESDGVEEGIVFVLETGITPFTATTFSIWRDDTARGAEHGEGIAWHSGKVFLTVEPA